MPTRNRGEFLRLAVESFQRQTYPNLELVIIDDSDVDITHLVPSDDRIRLYRSTQRRSIGAKRNIACSRADGEIICHWDDDDWSAPNRITDQVTRLQESKAALT